jgi:hypothetical protein
LRRTTLAFLSAIWILLAVVAFSSPYSEVVIQSCGVIRLHEYYIWKNGETYQLINLSNNSIVKEGRDFATLTNDAISLLGSIGGGMVYICEGVHIASQPITLASNVKLKGFTQNPSLVVIKQGSSSLWYPGVIGIVDKSNVEVAYLTIDMQMSPLVNGSSWPPKGNGITFRDDDNNNGNIYIHHVRLLNIPCYGIKTHFGSNITIHDIYFQNVWWDGMNIESTRVTIENVEGTDWGDVGIALYAAINATVKNCYFYDGKEPPGGGSSGVFGITFEGARNSVASNVTVRNSQYGVAAYTQNNNTVTHSVFINTFNVIGMGSDYSGYNNTIKDSHFTNSSVQIRGRNNQVVNSLFINGGVLTQDNADEFRIIGNTIINASEGIRFLRNSTNGLIQGNHIYCTTTPPITNYAIDFGYLVTNVNITVIQNDFTYNGTTNFRLGILNLAESTNINLIIEDNVGYP